MLSSSEDESGESEKEEISQEPAWELSLERWCPLNPEEEESDYAMLSQIKQAIDIMMGGRSLTCPTTEITESKADDSGSTTTPPEMEGAHGSMGVSRDIWQDERSVRDLHKGPRNAKNINRGRRTPGVPRLSICRGDTARDNFGDGLRGRVEPNGATASQAVKLST